MVEPVMGVLQVWDVTDGHLLAIARQRDSATEPSGGLLSVYPPSITSLAWSSDSRYLASARDVAVIVWSL